MSQGTRREDEDAVQDFVRKVRTLRQAREVEKGVPRQPRASLSPAQRLEVLAKTEGRCHICGGSVEGERWQSDHVLAHSRSGTSVVDNYLPAHATCNNYRWDYLPEEFEVILKLGVFVRTEVEKATPLGRKVAERFVAHEERREARRRQSPAIVTAPATTAGGAVRQLMAGTLRVVAVDWSGAVEGADSRIWLAEVADGVLCRVESGRGRTQLAQHLITLADQHPEIVVGLDFAFSFPEWFLRERGFTSAHQLWGAACHEGEAWLSACQPPFWGRPGRQRPTNTPAHFRRTDLEVPDTGGIRPKSVFQIGGAGAVGTGSVRGMATLHRLREAGFSVWPFDPPKFPLVVEIYPRVLTGAVNKSSRDERGHYLRHHHPDLNVELLLKASSTEDAFDAAVSAMVMAAHQGELLSLTGAGDETERLEGRIWRPRD